MIPLRLAPAPTTKAERARAEALTIFHRGHLDELVAHYGLPINRVVQVALRHLHRQVFAQAYAHDDTSAAGLAAEAVGGLVPLTQAQTSAVLANSTTRGADLAKQLGLGKGETILTLGDFFDRANAELAAADAAAAGKGKPASAGNPSRSKPAAKGQKRPAKAAAKAGRGNATSARIARA